MLRLQFGFSGVYWHSLLAFMDTACSGKAFAKVNAQLIPLRYSLVVDKVRI
jgi:hypothetical protein